MGKEKLVYILNPDGLTESIFVAKGEPNEGQYRGKRFTKAGWKAEKKRLKDDLLKQSLEQVPQNSSPLTVDNVDVGENKPSTVGGVKTWEEYAEYSHTAAINTVNVDNEENVVLPDSGNSTENFNLDPEPTGYEGDVITPAVKPDMETLLQDLENIPEEETIIEKPDTTTVYIVGDVQGVLAVLDGETMKPLRFDEHIPGFASQREITTYLTIAGYVNIDVDFIDSSEGTFFTVKAEHVQ